MAQHKLRGDTMSMVTGIPVVQQFTLRVQDSDLGELFVPSGNIVVDVSPF